MSEPIDLAKLDANFKREGGELLLRIKANPNGKMRVYLAWYDATTMPGDVQRDDVNGIGARGLLEWLLAWCLDGEREAR